MSISMHGIEVKVVVRSKCLSVFSPSLFLCVFSCTTTAMTGKHAESEPDFSNQPKNSTHRHHKGLRSRPHAELSSQNSQAPFWPSPPPPGPFKEPITSAHIWGWVTVCRCLACVQAELWQHDSQCLIRPMPMMGAKG